MIQIKTNVGISLKASVPKAYLGLKMYHHVQNFLKSKQTNDYDKITML